MFLVLTLISLIYGAVGAIKQITIKRTLAYTSISQTGFFFLGLISCSIEGFSASLFHVTFYIVTLFLFIVLTFFFIVLKFLFIVLTLFSKYCKQLLYSIVLYR